MSEYTRDELIAICEAAIVPEEQWRDRDSSSAQEGVGKAWAWLKAGVPFKVLRGGNLNTDERTIWMEFFVKGFSYYDMGSGRQSETVYLPTLDRLAETEERDWY